MKVIFCYLDYVAVDLIFFDDVTDVITDDQCRSIVSVTRPSFITSYQSHKVSKNIEYYIFILAIGVMGSSAISRSDTQNGPT